MITWSWVIRKIFAVSLRYLHVIFYDVGTYTCFSAAMMVCAGSWCEPELHGDSRHDEAYNMCPSPNRLIVIGYLGTVRVLL